MPKATKAPSKTFELAEEVDKEPTRLMTDFVEWLNDKVGYEDLDEKSVYLAWRLRLVFQASPENQNKLAARKAEIAAEKSAPKAPRGKAAKAEAVEEAAAPVARRRPGAKAAAEPAPTIAAPKARRRPAPANA